MRKNPYVSYGAYTANRHVTAVNVDASAYSGVICRLLNAREVQMAGDKWLTFDCYGTIADWNTCMRGALESVAGARSAAVLTAYHQAELVIEAGPSWLPYREVLSSALRLAARRAGVALDSAELFVDAWPQMSVFDDVGLALDDLTSTG